MSCEERRVWQWLEPPRNGFMRLLLVCPELDSNPATLTMDYPQVLSLFSHEKCKNKKKTKWEPLNPSDTQARTGLASNHQVEVCYQLHRVTES